VLYSSATADKVNAIVNTSSGVIYGSHSQYGLEFRGRNDIDVTLLGLQLGLA